MHAKRKRRASGEESETTKNDDADPSEESSSSDVVIVEPRANDVLFGRGDNINRHPGNKTFRDLVDKQRKVYLASQFKREKRMIADSIVSTIRNLKPPGRFLKKESKKTFWKPVDDSLAREKTLQALREKSKARAQMDRSSSPQTTESDEQDTTTERRVGAEIPSHTAPKQHQASYYPPPYSSSSYPMYHSGYSYPGAMQHHHHHQPPQHQHYPQHPQYQQHQFHPLYAPTSSNPADTHPEHHPPSQSGEHSKCANIPCGQQSGPPPFTAPLQPPPSLPFSPVFVQDSGRKKEGPPPQAMYPQDEASSSIPERGTDEHAAAAVAGGGDARDGIADNVAANRASPEDKKLPPATAKAPPTPVRPDAPGDYEIEGHPISMGTPFSRRSPFDGFSRFAFPESPGSIGSIYPTPPTIEAPDFPIPNQYTQYRLSPRPLPPSLPPRMSPLTPPRPDMHLPMPLSHHYLQLPQSPTRQVTEIQQEYGILQRQQQQQQQQVTMSSFQERQQQQQQQQQQIQPQRLPLQHDTASHHQIEEQQPQMPCEYQVVREHQQRQDTSDRVAYSPLRRTGAGGGRDELPSSAYPFPNVATGLGPSGFESFVSTPALLRFLQDNGHSFESSPPPSPRRFPLPGTNLAPRRQQQHQERSGSRGRNYYDPRRGGSGEHHGMA